MTQIINTYDQCVAAGGDRIAIHYTPNGDSRSMIYAHWSVHRYQDGKRVATDPKAHWQDYGAKTFSLFSYGGIGRNGAKRKAHALAVAIEWANENYGKREFVRNRMGDYVEREVNERFPIRREEL